VKVGLRVTGLSFEETMKGLPAVLDEVARRDGRRIGNAVTRKLKPAVPERTGAFRRQFRAPRIRRVGHRLKVTFRDLDERKFPALWGYVPLKYAARSGGRRWRKTSQNRRFLRAYDDAFFRALKPETIKAIIRRGVAMGIKGGRNGS